MKAALVALEKNLRLAFVGKRAVDIDEKSCDKLCNDAGKWHERSLELVAASSVML